MNQILKNGWLRFGIRWNKTITLHLDFVDDFRGNLFSEEVFVFTPKGELKTLPYGATALILHLRYTHKSVQNVLAPK
jgi:(p)ppGpp synthase/HD superfamily hydrolase